MIDYINDPTNLPKEIFCACHVRTLKFSLGFSRLVGAKCAENPSRLRDPSVGRETGREGDREGETADDKITQWERERMAYIATDKVRRKGCKAALGLLLNLQSYVHIR